MGNKTGSVPGKIHKNQDFDELTSSNSMPITISNHDASVPVPTLLERSVRISERGLVITYGYIRRIESDLSIIIPDVIKVEVSKFYGSFDKWNRQYSNHKFKILDDNESCITSHCLQKSYGIRAAYYHIFGNEIIENGEYVTWKLRFHGDCGNVHIGLVCDQHSSLMEYHAISRAPCGDFEFYFNCASSTIHYECERISYGEKCGKDGDLIEMTLDLSDQNDPYNGSIVFNINGVDYGVTSVEISKCKKYRFGVCLQDSKYGSQIELQ